MVTEPAAHIAMADIREKRKGHKSTADRILQGLGLVLLLLLLAAAGWAAVHYRQTVVRLWPGSERLYSSVGLPVNLTGLEITNVDFRQELQGDVPVLSVTGDVVNVSDRDQAIPKLRVVLRDVSSRELYRWTFDPQIPPLRPGSQSAFDTTLPSPPPDARSVDVTVAPEDAR